MEANERIDDLHRKDYKIIQNTDGFCFGIDAVLLTGFAKNRRNDKILDIGTGNGIIPILMEAKYNGKNYTAYEIQKYAADLANRNVLLNKLEDKINIINDDIQNYLLHNKRDEFDVITSNPPYMSNSGKTNDNEAKSIARHEITATINDILKISSIALKYGGKFFLVHRPNRLTDIIVAMRQYKIEPKTIRFVSPRYDKAPNIVLIEGIKGGKPNVNIMDNLIVYDHNGNYTDEVNKIYYE